MVKKKIIFSIFFFLMGHLGFAQTILDTTIDFSVQETPIADALNQLAETSAINISFSNNFFDPTDLVSLTFKQKPISVILHQILKSTGIEYQVLGDQLFLRRKAVPLKKHTISGYIKDASDGEKLIAASVFSPDHQQGTISNEYGFFSLTLPEGTSKIVCSYLGSKEKVLTVELTRNQALQIEMERSVTLAAIEVRPKNENGQQLFSTSANADEIAIKHLERIPDLGGEPDLLRAAQLLPGVQTGADGLGGLNIRGGNADQNLMLLDGVPIYNPSHLMGIFSIFNTSAIRDAKLIKGNFPARYGGRLSSVFDVRTREGNEKKWEGHLHTGLLSSSASLEGPLAKDKGAIILSGRHSHSSFLFDTITRAVFFSEYNGPLSFRFYDLNAKVNFTLGKKNRIFFSFYKGGDRFRVQEEELEESKEGLLSDFYETSISWGNVIGSLRWNHQYNDKLFSNTTLTYSQYQYNNTLLSEFLEEDFDGNEITNDYTYQFLGSEVQDFAAKIDFDYLPNPQHYWRFGAGLTSHFLAPTYNTFEGEDDDFGTPSDGVALEDLEDFFEVEFIENYEWFTYFEDEFDWGNRWKINAGLRISGLLEREGISYANLEPRLGARYALNDQWTAHGGVSRMVQYLHRIAGIGISKPDDIWIPSTATIEPQQAWQVALGLEYRTSQKLEISIESYLKQMDNLVSFNDTTFSIPFDLNFEEVLVFGSGLAYGLEFLVKKDFGKTGGHFSYTLASTTRFFPDLNLGFSYPYLFDRRHQISLFLFHKLGERFELATNFLYGSSHPLIAIENNEEFQLSTVPVNTQGNKNGSRNRGYHRLDLSLLYKYHKPRFQHTFKAGLYNTYNQANEAFFRLSSDQQGAFLDPVSFMPLLPSFSYTFKF